MLKDTKPGIPIIDTGANPTKINERLALKGISTIHILIFIYYCQFSQMN